MKDISKEIYSKSTTCDFPLMVNSDSCHILTVFKLFKCAKNLATEPSLWPAQLYVTVYQQQLVNPTA